MAETTSWLDFEAPEYTKNKGPWAFVRDHYTGDLLNAETIGTYLIPRKVGEPAEAYKERLLLADYTPHFSAVVDALAGMLFQVDNDTRRTWEGSVLGEPTDPESVIGLLWRDADGEGIGWPTLWKQAAIELIHSNTVWVTVDTDVQNNPMVRVIPAMAVSNWRHEDGRLVEVMVKEKVDLRTSIKEEPNLVDQVVLYNLEGWSRFTQDSEGNERAMGAGPYSYKDRYGNPSLPIFQVKLPMKRAVGYMLARKANAIFNKESERDFLLRVCNFPLLNVTAGDEAFAKIAASLKKGARVLQVDPNSPTGHSFIAPSSSPATVSSDVLARKVEEFYKVAFKEYADAAIERSATEIRQDVASGVGAFLQMLKAGVDEAENGILARLEQQTNPTASNIARVERSDQFLPMDVESQITLLKDRYFGQGQAAPAGEDAQVAAMTKILTMDGLPSEEPGVRANVRAWNLSQLVELTSSLPVPPLAKAELTVRLLAGLGVIDPEEAVELEDGSSVPLSQILREEALAMAESKRDASLRQAESFGAF